MGQRDSAALKRLLHMHRTLADRADFVALPCLHQCSRKSGEVTLIPILQAPDLLAQEMKAHLLCLAEHRAGNLYRHADWLGPRGDPPTRLRWAV